MNQEQFASFLWEKKGFSLLPGWKGDRDNEFALDLLLNGVTFSFGGGFSFDSFGGGFDQGDGGSVIKIRKMRKRRVSGEFVLRGITVLKIRRYANFAAVDGPEARD